MNRWVVSGRWECTYDAPVKRPPLRTAALNVLRLGIGLKEGEVPDDLKEYFRLASLGMYMERMSQQPDPTFVQAFDAARARAVPYFRRS